MPTTSPSYAHTAYPLPQPAPPKQTVGWGSFARHYLEMVITMVIGMMALHPVWQLAFDAIGLPGSLDHATVMALVMATDMSVGMGGWMRYRGHSWRSITEMSVTMYLPFAVFLPAVWAGSMSGGAMITAGHLLMLPAMLGLMLWRRAEYGRECHTDTTLAATAVTGEATL